jgi:hypothetical protein
MDSSARVQRAVSLVVKLVFSLTGDNRFQMGKALFKPLIESLEKNTCQITHRIGYARVELSSTKSIDGVGQQSRDLACITERMIQRV